MSGMKNDIAIRNLAAFKFNAHPDQKESTLQTHEEGDRNFREHCRVTEA